jgi:tetratricopeptide (TPR) repeat protein
LLGDTWCEKHNFPEAIKNYNKVLEFDHDDVTAINDRAEAYAYMDDWDNAIQDYKRLNILVPEEPSPYYNCGVCYRMKGDLGKAVEYFDKAIELGKREARVYKHRGHAYMGMGEYDKAIADYKQVEELGDNFVSLYVKLAMEMQASTKKFEGKILDRDTITALEGSLLEQCKGNKKNYGEYLIHKYIDFVKGKAVLDAYVRIVIEPLDDVAKYILIEIAGLIISCFELPMFKRKETGKDKYDEMHEYIKNLSHEYRFMVSALRGAILFADSGIKREYEDWIKENDLLPEVKAEHEDVYDVLARYPSRQPHLREHIVDILFLSSIESPLESKLSLAFHFHLIIEFLCEFYFSENI